MSKRPVSFWTEAFPGRPVHETAVSRALLLRVGAGAAPETFRLHRTDAVLAFSPRDRRRPGFARAVEAARRAGFTPVLRLAGGHAAAFHSGTLAFAWSRPVPDPREGLVERFEEMASILVGALRRLGVDARVGAVPGEYCPGEHSVNAGGRTKLCGTGQRLVPGAAHVGGVIVFDGSDRLRDVLVPVYRALDLELDPMAVGSIADEVGPLPSDDVEHAIRRELADRFELRPGDPDPEALTLAAELAGEHVLAGAYGPHVAPTGLELSASRTPPRQRPI